MKKTISIIGGGAAALMIAAGLDQNKFDVTIYEKNKALGRKFLVAGDGGFNLTHSENIDEFVLRYTPSEFLEKSLRAFTNEDFRVYLKKLGIETFVGSSKRVYPLKGIKPIEVLNAFLELIKQKGIGIKTQCTFTGFGNNNEIIFNNDVIVESDYVIFALGGASWSKASSNGAWFKYFESRGIQTVPFQASNCAFKVNWDQAFIKQFAGEPLKNITLQCDVKVKAGELVITAFGIEGGAIYALSPEIRQAINTIGYAPVYLDFKPQLTSLEILRKLMSSRQKNISERLRSELNLSSAQISLIKLVLTKEEYQNTEVLSEKVKSLPIAITGLAPIDEAISTVGGIALHEVNEQFELIKLKNHFVIGEMLDWDAPTGGYLLQACMSMGRQVANYLNSVKV